VGAEAAGAPTTTDPAVSNQALKRERGRASPTSKVEHLFVGSWLMRSLGRDRGGKQRVPREFTWVKPSPR
jgi:hypothetical protein